MSDHPESQFTITFGQSSRVVKRSGRTMDIGMSRSQLSVKDRLGTIVDDALEVRNHHRFKRQRVEENMGFHREDGSNDTSLGYPDLRFKLMQKSVSNQFLDNDPPSDIDLRDKLSSKATLPPADARRSRSPIARLGKRKNMFESRDIYDSNLHNMVERQMYDDGRQGMRERDPRGTYSLERQSHRDPRDTFRFEGSRMRDPRESFNVERQRARDPRDSFNAERQRVRDSRDSFGVERQGKLHLRDTFRATYDSGRRSVQDYRDGYDIDRRSWREPRHNYNAERRSIRGPEDMYNVERQNIYDVERRGMKEPRDHYDAERRNTRGSRGIYNVERQNMQGLGDTYSAGRRSMLERRDTYNSGRRSMQEPRDSYYAGRRTIQDSRDSNNNGRQSIREPRNSYNYEEQSTHTHRGSYSVGRRSIRDPRDTRNVVRHIIHEPKNRYSAERRRIRTRSPSSNSGSDVPLVVHARARNTLDDLRRRSPGTVSESEPSTSPGTDVPAVSHARKSYSSDDVRERSPETEFESSMSPESDVEELQRKALIQTYDDGTCTANVYRRNDVSSPQRAVRSASLTEHQRAVRSASLTEHHGINAVPHLPANTIAVTAQFSQSSRAAPRLPNRGEQFTIDGFLQSLDLMEYSGHFNDEEVDFPALLQMSDTELKELGIPMGPRRRILHALPSTR